MVKNGASIQKTNYIFSEIPNPEGHQNPYIDSKVTTILLNGWILPTVGASSRRACACSLCSLLVFFRKSIIKQLRQRLTQFGMRLNEGYFLYVQAGEEGFH